MTSNVMELMMRIIAFFLLVFVFLACSSEEKAQVNEEQNDEVLIEQNDEKTEVNDTNVPLPVGESSSALQTQFFALTLFHKGGGG